MAEPIYDDAEVEEILRSALERGGQTDGLTHAELAEVAAEVGLSTEELEQAARGVLAARAERREREEAQRVLAVRKRQRRRGFAQHVLTWGVVGAGLAALDQLTGAGISWALYPIVGWGIGVGLHGVGLIFADDEKEIRQIARQLRKQRERAAREAARSKEKKRPKVTAEAALEHALEKGIALLLTKVAEKLEAAAAPSPAPRDTELNRFIAQKKGGPVRVAPAASSPRTRVEGGAAVDADADADADAEVAEVPRDRRTKRERGA